jgi:hypothetical protein
MARRRGTQSKGTSPVGRRGGQPVRPGDSFGQAQAMLEGLQGLFGNRGMTGAGFMPPGFSVFGPAGMQGSGLTTFGVGPGGPASANAATQAGNGLGTDFSYTPPGGQGVINGILNGGNVVTNPGRSPLGGQLGGGAGWGGIGQVPPIFGG